MHKYLITLCIECLTCFERDHFQASSLTCLLGMYHGMGRGESFIPCILGKVLQSHTCMASARIFLSMMEKPVSMSSLLSGRIFWPRSDGVLIAHAQWLLGACVTKAIYISDRFV